MASSAKLQEGASGSKSLISRYLEEARRVHGERSAENPIPLGDRLVEETAANTAASQRVSSERIDELVEPYLFYVVQVAAEFNRRDVSFEDLLAEGNMGLVEAAHHFDPSHRVKFLTYATWWIRKRILEYLVAEGKPVRLTRYAREKRRELQAARAALEERLGREPTFDEIREETGLEKRTLRDLTAAPPTTVSLEKPVVTDAGLTVGDCLAAREESPEATLARRTIHSLAMSEVSRLPHREQAIIRNRFAFDGQPPLTFEEIGVELGLSRERVRQLEQRGLEILRRRIHRQISVLELPSQPVCRARRRARRNTPR